MVITRQRLSLYLNNCLSYLMWGVGFAFIYSSSLQADQYQPALAIIIDDLGHSQHMDMQVANLPGPITLAILPHTQYATQLANRGRALGKQIMLHAPMENHRGLALGLGGLTSSMEEVVFKQTLQDSIASIPHVEGVNNHTGSALTEMQKPMQWTMEVIANAGLFFVDSRTTKHTLAYQEAQKHRIASTSRNIFLDNDTSHAALDKEFNKAIAIAKKMGSATIIAHPYAETIAYLKTALPQLDAKGIRLVSASALIKEIIPQWTDDQQNLADNQKNQ